MLLSAAERSLQTLDRRRLYLISLILAFFIVVASAYNSCPCIPRLNLHINKIKTLGFNGSKMLVIDELGKRLFVVNEERKVVFVGKIAQMDKAPEYIEDAALDKNYIYLCGHDTKNKGPYSILEHIEQYDMKGKHVRTVYSEKIAEEDEITDSYLVSLHNYRDRLYMVRIDPQSMKVYVLLVDRKGSAKEIMSTKCPFIILGADYDCEYNKLSVTDCYNNAYIATAKESLRKVDVVEYFQGDRESMQNALSAFISINLIKRLVLAKTWCWQLYDENNKNNAYAFMMDLDNCVTFYDIKTGKTEKVSKIPCSMKLVFISIIYLFAIAWLLLSLLYGLCMLWLKCSARLRKDSIYIACGLIVSAGVILYYSYNIREIMEEQYKLKTNALSHIAIHDMKHIMPDFDKDLMKYGVHAFIANETYKSKMDTLRGHLAAVCADSGENDQFYVRLMLCDNDGGLVNYFDVLENYPCGDSLVSYNLSECMEAIARDGWIYRDSNFGRVAASYRPLYDDSNMLYGIIETGYVTENLKKLAFKKSVLLFVSILTLLLYLVPMLFFVLRKANDGKWSGWS